MNYGWRAAYDDGMDLWLGNQIGSKGMAVLIERHHIHIAPMAGKGCIWCATVVDEAGRGAWKEGRTPLVAAMRALVASRYGVEVPD